MKKRKIQVENEKTAAADERELLSAACSLIKVDNEKTESPKPDHDGVFCSMLANQLRNVGEGKEKEMLKMDLQRLIFNVMYPDPSTTRIPTMHQVLVNPMTPIQPKQKYSTSSLHINYFISLVVLLFARCFSRIWWMLSFYKTL